MSQTDPPLQESAQSRPQRARQLPWVWIGVAVVVLVLVIAAIAVPVAMANQQKAEVEAAARAAAEQAAKDERDRLNMFNAALGACRANVGPAGGVDILDSGESVEFTGVARTFASELQVDDLYCVLEHIGAPSSLESKIAQTRALDGRQSDDWDGFSIEWSYHPDSGANVIIEHEK